MIVLFYLTIFYLINVIKAVWWHIQQIHIGLNKDSIYKVVKLNIQNGQHLNRNRHRKTNLACGAKGQSFVPQQHVLHFFTFSLSIVLIDYRREQESLKALSLSQFYSGLCCSTPSFRASYKCWSIQTVTFF